MSYLVVLAIRAARSQDHFQDPQPRQMLEGSQVIVLPHVESDLRNEGHVRRSDTVQEVGEARGCAALEGIARVVDVNGFEIDEATVAVRASVLVPPARCSCSAVIRGGRRFPLLVIIPSMNGRAVF